MAILMLAMAACGSDSSSESAATTLDVPVSTVPTTVPPEVEVTAGPAIVLANDYGLPDTTGWETAVVFDLTNSGEDVVAVPYRVEVASADGQTRAVSDGTDKIVIPPGDTVTVVNESTEPTGPSAPTQATVTVYGRAEPPADFLNTTEWTSANEFFDCNNGLVGCGLTGDLTYTGSAQRPTGPIQVIVFRDDTIVAAGTATTEILDAVPGQPIPYAGQITSAADFDGAGFTRIEVAVAEETFGD